MKSDLYDDSEEMQLRIVAESVVQEGHTIIDHDFTRILVLDALFYF